MHSSVPISHVIRVLPLALQIGLEVAFLVVYCILPIWCGALAFISVLFWILQPYAGAIHCILLIAIVFVGIASIGVLGFACVNCALHVSLGDAAVLCITLACSSGIGNVCDPAAPMSILLEVLWMELGTSKYRIFWPHKDFDSTLGFPGEGPPKRDAAIRKAELKLLMDLAAGKKSFAQVCEDATTFSYDGSELQRLASSNAARGITRRLEELTGISADSLTYMRIRTGEGNTSVQPFALLTNHIEEQ